jgi:hypothetical protein
MLAAKESAARFSWSESKAWLQGRFSGEPTDGMGEVERLLVDLELLEGEGRAGSENGRKRRVENTPQESRSGT